MDQLDESLAAEASLLAELTAHAMEPDLRAVGITRAAFDVLSTAHATGGRATQIDVARRLGVTPPTLSEAVKALVGLKLIEQRGDPDDARRRILRLTPEGSRVLFHVVAGVARREAEMLRGIDPADVAQARNVLRRASRNLARTLHGGEAAEAK